MRRGRIFIYLALIIILVVGAGGAYYYFRILPKNNQAAVGTPTPQIVYKDVITAGQNINAGTLITENMLSSIQLPEDKIVGGMQTRRDDVIGKYTQYPIKQGMLIIDSMLSAASGDVNLPGSTWAPLIPQGLTAVSIPVSRLSSAAYGIRDGDFVNIMVTTLLVDIDPALQTVLPNKIANLEISGTGEDKIIKITEGGVIQGHFEVDEVATDPVSKLLVYVQPSELQRGRLVTQMVMQNIQVLHMGDFKLPEEEAAAAAAAQAAANQTTTPTPTPADQAPAAITKPDIITLMVSPQDAVTLTYLVYSKAQITLTLRNPNDETPIQTTDAATLEYLLTQYDIPVPAKLPYSTQPRMDDVQAPVLKNDIGK
jgi:Flp pilus assembly protein CpaB